MSCACLTLRNLVLSGDTSSVPVPKTRYRFFLSILNS